LIPFILRYFKRIKIDHHSASSSIEFKVTF